MTTLLELIALRDEAKVAYHDLMIGKAVASARDQNGEEVRYTQADATKLASYIASLEALIAGLDGTPCRVLGPMRVFF